MGNFGELVLILGDLHMPERATSIHESFKRMLVPNKMQHVICTGNISLEQYNEFRGLAPNVVCCRGDLDDEDMGFPEHSICTVGNFRIGVIHGHQIVPHGSHDAKARMRRKLNVDILVTGHSHKNEVVLRDGFYHINPGSISGASSAHSREVTPSFILLAIQENKLVCYVYELLKGEVEVSKTEFVKSASSESSPVLLQSLL
eukprot:CAMPEP_0113634944 /NCGR_PEP_ID=MMETSP0017_2-20120614/18203_1 /TAXON_ID=2856 /ORGANISM="Cylindrotheca closterium" /LENGTH=201 /DNA_ID=CAMNT_0000545679 /DNA_START=64 /DNA_END=666 /DNA_ORIENTATION=- /assembly_acc=CAM_ASM_000147